MICPGVPAGTLLRLPQYHTFKPKLTPEMVPSSLAAKPAMCLRRKYAGEELDHFTACRDSRLVHLPLPMPVAKFKCYGPSVEKGHKLGPRLFPGCKNRDRCLPARRKNVRLLWKLSVSKSWHLPALHLAGKKVLVLLACTCVGTQSKSCWEYRDASSRAQRAARGKACSQRCLFSAQLKIPKPTIQSKPHRSSPPESAGSERKSWEKLVLCSLGSCPSARQGGNLSCCLSVFTQVDGHTDGVSAICGCREKRGAVGE